MDKHNVEYELAKVNLKYIHKLQNKNSQEKWTALSQNNEIELLKHKSTFELSKINSRVKSLKYRNDNFTELSDKSSLEYYTDDEYRNTVDNDANDSNKKIILNLNNRKEVTDTLNLNNVHELNINNCVCLHNICNLSSVFMVDLGRNDITDVSCLGSIHTLHLSGCKNITDVSKLHSVYSLNISNCNNIKNVSKLHSVNSLNISYCNNIKNICTLTLLEKLNISHCERITDIGNLRKLKVLTISTNVYGIHLLKKLNEVNLISKRHGKIEKQQRRAINTTVNLTFF